MSFKYAKFDLKLFAWLRGARVADIAVTTADAVSALKVSNKPTLQRHISRRFTQLENKGVLHCTHRGTTRICRVVADIPDSLAKQPWRAGITKAVASHLESIGKRPTATPSPLPSIRALTSDEFIAAGGVVEKLPTHWDEPRSGSKPLGDSFSFDD